MHYARLMKSVHDEEGRCNLELIYKSGLGATIIVLTSHYS